MRAAQEQTFVGRALERQRLEDPLTRAVAGRAGVVLVLGELGSGKTALLEVFLSATARSGVLSAAADEAQTALPFGVLDQVWHDLDALGSLSGGGPEPPVAGPPVVHGTHRCGARPHPGGRPAAAGLLGRRTPLRDVARLAQVVDPWPGAGTSSGPGSATSTTGRTARSWSSSTP